MAIYQVRGPDGRIHEINGPAGATQEQVVAAAMRLAAGGQKQPTSAQPQQAKTPAQAEPSVLRSIGKSLGNLAAGAVRGAGSIGATIVAPGDILADALLGKSATGETRNEARRRMIDEGLASLGADTGSVGYAVGKTGAEVAGTLGVGGALGRGVLAVAPRAVPLANALTTGGMGGGNLLTRAIGGAAAGGASAGLVDPGSAGTGAVIGGVIPGGAALLSKGGGSLSKAVRGGDVSSEVKALADRAKQLGIDIPADRIVNSRPLNAVTSGLNYVPFSGRAATEDKMVGQLTKAATRLIGQDSDNMAKALRQAGDELGKKFDDVLTQNAIHVDAQLARELADISNSANRELGADGLKAISGQIDELISKGVSGSIDGQAAYNIKRTLDRIGRRNTPEAHHALELKKTLMGALDRSLGPAKAASFAKTRQQYGNMIALEKIAKNGVDGDISVARLANMPNINNKEMQEIADIAAQFVRARESPHGSMQRAVVALGAGSMGGPAALLGGAAAGRATNMLLNSNAARNYVTGTPGPVATGANKLVGLVSPTVYRAAPVVLAPRVSKKKEK